MAQGATIPGPFSRGCRRAAIPLALLLGACAPGGRDQAPSPNGGSAGSTELLEIHWGRLVDVYGLRGTGEDRRIERVGTDILIGVGIADERTGDSPPDESIRYDFLSPDPETLQPRLLIPRQVGSDEFKAILDGLDDDLRRVPPARFGQGTGGPPPLVPRNASLRLTFSRTLTLDEGFFVERNETGEPLGPKNHVAIQLLRIVGDPEDNDPSGDFRPIPHRVIPRGHQLLLDPVLIGSEGPSQRTKNNASGLPAGADQRTLNMRLALPLRDPLAIPGLRLRTGFQAGADRQARDSIVRDFRSGHPDDESSDITNGFMRTDAPLRLLGELPFRLAGVTDRDRDTQELTLYKDGFFHEINLGDGLRLYADNATEPTIVADVISDPSDDRGNPAVQFVRVRVRRDAGFAALDPSQRADYPKDRGARADWLARNGPRVVVVAPYEAERSDDIRNFVRFAPEPLPLADGRRSPGDMNVSPFAGAILRFSQPVDLRSVRPLDTLFFATRDVVTEAGLEQFARERDIKRSDLDPDKVAIPHLVHARVFDEDGSQTKIRLQPELGFYLDDILRGVDDGKPLSDRRFNYHLHLISGANGIRDLAGNSLDLGTEPRLRNRRVLPFALDTRTASTGRPLFADNLVASVVRRYRKPDEDPRPSYYRADEAPGGSTFNPDAYPLPDIYGGVLLSTGVLSARLPGRVSRWVDDANQQQPPDATCPPGELSDRTTSRPFQQPLANPFNPFGCRQQMVWRELDLDFSRVDANDMDLDVEALFWCPFQGQRISFDEFDRVSLFLGHSEYRPEPCIRSGGALPSMVGSGLKTSFADNYAHSRAADGSRAAGERPHPAFVDAIPWIDAGRAVRDPGSNYNYVPLPEFQKPYFVWRDQRKLYQGGDSGRGTDRGDFGMEPYIKSPFLAGLGRYATDTRLGPGAWDNRRNFRTVGRATENATGGLVGTIGLPLLADFWVYPDSPELPAYEPFLASGLNGWQVSLAVGSSALPAFRAYSGGALIGRKVEPDKELVAMGGYQPNGQSTRPLDSTFFWTRADFRKRLTVSTAGFVEFTNPHRVTIDNEDPRLGPFSVARGARRDVAVMIDPPERARPAGTSISIEFRGAGDVDPMPWAAASQADPPTADNFPLDPFKAGDAHIRKRDHRAGRTWTHYYNWQITEYTNDLSELEDGQYLQRFADPDTEFRPEDVRYFNWRLIFEAAPETGATPVMDSLAVSYRWRSP